VIVLLLALTFSLPPPVSGCHPLSRTDVVRVMGGYVVISATKLVHEWETGMSGDDRYWGCYRHGELLELKVPNLYEDEEN